MIYEKYTNRGDTVSLLNIRREPVTRPKANEERDSSIICLSVECGDESEIKEAGIYQDRFLPGIKIFRE
jgi:hypothetical protein